MKILAALLTISWHLLFVLLCASMIRNRLLNPGRNPGCSWCAHVQVHGHHGKEHGLIWDASAFTMWGWGCAGVTQIPDRIGRSCGSVGFKSRSCEVITLRPTFQCIYLIKTHQNITLRKKTSQCVYYIYICTLHIITLYTCTYIHIWYIYIYTCIYTYRIIGTYKSDQTLAGVEASFMCISMSFTQLPTARALPPGSFRTRGKMRPTDRPAQLEASASKLA